MYIIVVESGHLTSCTNNLNGRPANTLSTLSKYVYKYMLLIVVSSRQVINTVIPSGINFIFFLKNNPPLIPQTTQVKVIIAENG